MQQNIEQGEIQQGEEISQSDDEYIRTTKAGRKDLCKCCRNALSKYTCPRCSFRTCSLGCTRKHKQLQNCKGFLDPAQKVSKSEISEKTVRKDYQFVNNMISGSDKVRKCLTGVSSSHQEPKRFYFLKKQAKIDHNIKIHQAPAIIERHRDNISFYYMKTKQIFWVIQILYFKGKGYTRHILLPTQDSKTIEQIIPQTFLCTQLLVMGINTQKKQQFKVYIENRQAQPDSSKNKKTTISQFSQNMILREALKNKNVYEYPTLILVHKSLDEQFCHKKKIKIQKIEP